MEQTAIHFTVGSRHLVSVERQLATWSFSLEEALGGVACLPNPPPPGKDGFRVLSLPNSARQHAVAQFPGYLIGAVQLYRRHYIEMVGGYEGYLARFSGKTRSTLRRKQRKLAKEAGESYRVSEHRTPAEVEAFLEAAIPLSSRTYQARLLGAGLPDGPQARDRMLAEAEANRMRCFLLHAEDRAIAYLSLPVLEATLVYAHLGYDPDWARLSPGTVLQMEALERLFAEQRFQYFDFTEGEGAHKAMFGTDSIECSSFLLLEPTLANRALLGARSGFDGLVSGAKRLAERSGVIGHVRSLLKA